MNRRYTVGCVKPTTGSPSHGELEALLPEGVGTVLRELDVRHGTIREFEDAIDGYHRKVAEVAAEGADLIIAEGTPPFMLKGFAGEAKILRGWEEAYGVPVFTSGTSQVAGLRALGARRIVGIGYDFDDPAIVARYFTDAGFEVLGLDKPEGVRWEDIGGLTEPQIVDLITAIHRRHPAAEAIYIQGSKWRTLGVIEPLEKALGIPVVQPVAVRCWEIQRRLGLRVPRPGYGRLLAELPPL